MTAQQKAVLTTYNGPPTQTTTCGCKPGLTGPDGECTACVVGTYKAGMGSAACDGCPADSSSPTQSTTIAACTCNAGFSGQVQCVSHDWVDKWGQSCEYYVSYPEFCSGQSSQEPSANCCACGGGRSTLSCTKCVKGKYKNVLGDAACLDCDVGKYAANTGATVCQACPTLSNAPEGSNTQTDCICNMGSTGPNGGTCVSCVAGKFKSSLGPAICTPCDAGTYSAMTARTTPTACSPCGDGTYSASASASCTTCPANAISPSSSAEASACRCNAGFSGPNGGGSCTKCSAGTYKTESGNANCISCPANANSPAGSTALWTCFCTAGSAGQDGGTCTQCVAGKYKAGGGNANCESCPTNSASPVGSTISTACECTAGWIGPNGGPCRTAMSSESKTAASEDIGSTTSSPSGGGLDDTSTSSGTSTAGASGSGEPSWVLPVIISCASVGFLALGLAFRWYNQKKLQRHLKALSDLASAELGSVRQPTNTPQFEATSDVFLDHGQDRGQVQLGVRPPMMAYRDPSTSSAEVPNFHQVWKFDCVASLFQHSQAGVLRGCRGSILNPRQSMQ